MQISYVPKRFAATSLAVIEAARLIIAEYRAEGFTLTLRQLYYQFVARDLLANRQSEYKRLGTIVSDARNAGLIDWETIEDRTRNVRENSHWGSPAELLAACADQFRFDLWEDQPYRPEVWIEKDALLGVFEGICEELDVPLTSCRGYTSQSEAWAAGRRLRKHGQHGQTPIILHFSDHDPSGIDMTRDLAERLSLYAEREVSVDRLALNRAQIEQYEPPPNPAKVTDSRYAAYLLVHGDESWELDALEPRILTDLVRTAIERLQEPKAWDSMLRLQDAARRRLRKLSQTWEDGAG